MEEVEHAPAGGVGSSKTATATVSRQSQSSDDPDPEREHHFGPANPLGPISETDGSRTTRSLTTEENDRRGGGRGGGTIRTAVHTTVCADGEAYRTTRVSNQYRLLSATYEKSVPRGTTRRIVRTYHRGSGGGTNNQNKKSNNNTNVQQQPYYEQTAEIVQPGGSTTVRQQTFDMADRPLGRETVQEFPPTEITPRPRGGWAAAAAAGVGGATTCNLRPLATNGAKHGETGLHEEDACTLYMDQMTAVSELTYPRISRPVDVDEDEQHTLAGMTTKYDDPTVDPTVVDYNAGYSEEMARKHNTGTNTGTMAVGGMIGGLGYDAERALPLPPTIDGSPSSPGASAGRSGRKSFGAPKGNGVRKDMEGRGMTNQTKLIVCGTAALVGAIAIGAAVGAVTARNRGSGSNGTGKTTGNNSTITTDPPSPSPPPATTTEILTQSGFGRHWRSEDGWPVAPSYASFVPHDDTLGIDDDDASSYYDAFSLPDLATCADRCDDLEAVGGAYFDRSFSDEKQRSVCLCYKDVQCYDSKLTIGGGTVFVREDRYAPESLDECPMSTCGYFPEDPICDGLSIIDLEAELGVELRTVERLLQEDEIRAFQQACADFLNEQFFVDSPVEGVRCHLLTQDLTDRRRKLLSVEGGTLEENDALLLEMRVTGLLVPTPKYADAESVAFEATVLGFFDEQGGRFLQRLRNAENTGDYYENVRGISLKTSSGGPVQPIPQPTPANPKEPPSPSPTRMPVPLPTTDEPTQSPTSEPTISLSPTEYPTTAIFADRSKDFDELIYFSPEIVGSAWKSEGMGPFGRCAGDCDTDADCRGLTCDEDDNCLPGLLCYQRSGSDDATVPGCAGTAEDDVDYCYWPSYVPDDRDEPEESACSAPCKANQLCCASSGKCVGNSNACK